MAGGVQHAHAHSAGLDDVTVANTDAVERDRVVGIEQILRTGRAGQLVAAGHVVVVDVRLEHVRDPHIRLLGQLPDPVVIALRVHDQGDLAVVGKVAAVAQPWGVHGKNSDHENVRSFHFSMGWPERVQAVVPPATLMASTPAERSRFVAFALRLPDWQST